MKYSVRPQIHGLTPHVWFGSLASFAACTPLLAAAPPSVPAPARGASDFMNLSLEELGSVKVTSVSKKAERLDHAPAAITVITSEEMRRAGVLTLPDALRLAPGVQVGRVDASQSAVSIRGFNDTYSQKLLVLMDGRSIYSQLFSGVFWQSQDYLLADLDRIEVVRGPGGTLWGANAVNGVINIVSKPASETQGLLLTAGGGTDQSVLGGVRYGVQLAEHTFFRLYGKYDSWENSDLVGGGEAFDARWKAQSGFRLDSDPSETDHFTLQGDLVGLQADQLAPQITLPVFLRPPPPGGYNSVRQARWDQTEGNLLGRWTHQFSEESEFTLQAYYHRSRVDMSLLDETRDTYDVDLRHRFQLGARNEIVWGGGYRLTTPQMTQGREFTLSRLSRADEIFNAFVQDELTVVPERLRMALGSKIEHNDYTGFEVEPGARLAWTPTERQTLWGSVARAVRTPSQFEHDASGRLGVALAPPPLPPVQVVVSAAGSTAFDSEVLLAYELGYRVKLSELIALEATGFLNDYDRLRSFTPSADLTSLPNYAGMINRAGNGAGGRTYGGEFSVTFQAADWWRLQGHCSVLKADLNGPVNPLTNLPEAPFISAPEFQASLRSSMDLGRQVQFDCWLRHAGKLSIAGGSFSGLVDRGAIIPSYVTFDVRLAWRPTPNLEISLVGQNLAGSHREFIPTFVTASITEVRPSVYGRVTLSF